MLQSEDVVPSVNIIFGNNYQILIKLETTNKRTWPHIIIFSVILLFLQMILCSQAKNPIV